MVNCAFQRNASGVVVTTSPPFYNETHRSHVLCVKAESNTTLHPGYSTILLRSESPSGMCAKLRTVAASNNRVHTPRSLYYCLFVPPIYGVVLRTHSVRGEPCISAQHQPSGCNRIITSKQQKSSKSDPVLIRQFKKNAVRSSPDPCSSLVHIHSKVTTRRVWPCLSKLASLAQDTRLRDLLSRQSILHSMKNYKYHAASSTCPTSSRPRSFISSSGN